MLEEQCLEYNRKRIPDERHAENIAQHSSNRRTNTDEIRGPDTSMTRESTLSKWNTNKELRSDKTLQDQINSYK